MKKIVWENLTETEKEVDRVINERWILGRKRYKSQGLTYKTGNSPIAWCQEAIEECADQLQYLVALKLLLQKGVKK
jgi:hypothetical protein